MKDLSRNIANPSNDLDLEIHSITHSNYKILSIQFWTHSQFTSFFLDFKISSRTFQLYMQIVFSVPCLNPLLWMIEHIIEIRSKILHRIYDITRNFWNTWESNIWCFWKRLNEPIVFALEPWKLFHFQYLNKQLKHILKIQYEPNHTTDTFIVEDADELKHSYSVFLICIIQHDFNISFFVLRNRWSIGYSLTFVDRRAPQETLLS